MKRVIIESPFRAQDHIAYRENVSYAQMALRDSLMRGEAPLAFHLLYTQSLNDAVAEERELGMKVSREWYKHVDIVAVYEDHGTSSGMESGITYADNLILEGYELEIDYRRLKD
jgi:hypothetical protein